MSHTIGQTKQNNQQSDNSFRVKQNFLKPNEQSTSPRSTLSDADYEFLFNQLLEGIAHGWHDRRIVKFFIRLGDRAEQKDWIVWLERLKDRASVLPSQSKRQLGTMMIRLGELTRSTAEIDQIGTVSHRIGRELLFDNVESVWEYAGPDLLPKRDRSKHELSERLPNDFNALSSYKLVEETAEESSELNEANTSESKSSLTKEHNSFSTTELPQPENAAQESLATESDWDQSLSKAERTASSSDTTADIEPDYSTGQKSSRKSELYITKAAIPDESTINSADFLENISQSEPTTPDTISSASKLDSSLSNPNLIVKTESDRNSLEDVAELVDTEAKIEAFDVSQVMNLIQKDEELAQQISQKLNSEIAKTQSTVSQLEHSSLELIESWFNLGLKQVSVGEFTKAIASWEKALSINPHLSEAWHNRGSALGRLGDYHAAIESFQNSLEIDPDNYQAWNDRAHALYQLQNWAEAADSWSNAIKILPGNHLFWYNRGCALEQLQRWDEAIASHEKALEIVPNFQPGRSRYINLVADSSRSN